MSIINGFYNSYRSLMVNQAALSVVSNNISNMNTEGYSKQTIGLTALSNNSADSNDLFARASSGYGATIDSISRSRDSYLDNYYRTENSDASYYTDMAGNAQFTEDITNELNNSGLMDSLNQFYKASQSMSLNPTNMVTRTDFVSKAVDVANQFSSSATKLTDLRTSLVGDISDPNSLKTSKISLYCDDLNDKLAKVAKLNESIVASSSGGQAPNSLLDERDKLLDSISEYVPITVKETASNLINIYVGGVEVVKGTSFSGKFSVAQNSDPDPVAAANNPAIVSIVDPESGNAKATDVKNIIDSGKVMAALTMGGSKVNELNIKNILDKLDTLAVNFAKEVNAAQLYTQAAVVGPPAVPDRASACLDGSTPVQLKQATFNIFVDTPTTPALPPGTTAGISALNIHVNQSVIDSPSEIATAIVETDPTGILLTPAQWNPLDPTQVGNNEAALKIAQIRDNRVAGLANSTTENYITSLIGDIGVKASGINKSLDTQTAVVDQLKVKRESATGVNLDEELMDLTRYQRSYQASSRVFTVTNEILQAIINLGK
jgi:flagellar hook-associated protein 1 FlgK